MTDELLDAVAELPKVCEHIEVPVQAGDDEVLAQMRRGYTADDYRGLIARIRQIIPGVSIATDIIVGFSGETEAQFQCTYDLLAELELDKAHIARYSPRPQTLAARRLPDDVEPEEKERRRKALDDLQAGIVAQINGRLLGQRSTDGCWDRRSRCWSRGGRRHVLLAPSIAEGSEAEGGAGGDVPAQTNWFSSRTSGTGRGSRPRCTSPGPGHGR
jgi:tRNA-2-methylthio-N6-dimethylallyladenosine synthase